jgi:hypothetical protein
MEVLVGPLFDVDVEDDKDVVEELADVVEPVEEVELLPVPDIRPK